jgi:hypothetical protein
VDDDRELVVTWGPEIPISPPQINTFVPRITTWGDGVHVTWMWQPAGMPKIQLRSSFDRGSTWRSVKTVVSGQTMYGRSPAIAAWRKNLYIACHYWQDYPLPYFQGTGFTKSSNLGQIWISPPTGLIWETLHPAVSALNSCINIVAVDNHFVYHRLSIDGGNNYLTQDTISSLGTSPQPIRLNAIGNYVYLSYPGGGLGVTGSLEIIYQRSTDYGRHFGPPVILSTNDSIPSQCPSLACSENGDVYVIWMDGRYSPYSWSGDILLRHSPDFGEHWEEEVILTNDHLARTNAVAARGSQVHVAWERTYPGYSSTESDIAYRYSENHGQNWSAVVQLSNAHKLSQDLDMIQSGDTLHLVWEDGRGQGSKIYYRQAVITPSRDISTPSSPVISLSTDLPCHTAFYISPNPFNSTTSLKFFVNQLSYISLTIYNIKGDAIKSLYQGLLAPGAHEFEWEGKNNQGFQVSAGMYLAIWENNGRITSCRKVLFMK